MSCVRAVVCKCDGVCVHAGVWVSLVLGVVVAFLRESVAAPGVVQGCMDVRV